jgi:hypothetical protein
MKIKDYEELAYAWLKSREDYVEKNRGYSEFDMIDAFIAGTLFAGTSSMSLEEQMDTLSIQVRVLQEKLMYIEEMVKRYAD